jgi:hypothetical protein
MVNVTQISTTITMSSGSSTPAVASAAGLTVGMFVSHPKFPIGTRIEAISGTTLTTSHDATGAATSSTARFSSILDAQTLGAIGGSNTISTTLVTANLPAYTPSGGVTATFPSTVLGNTPNVLTPGGSPVGFGGAATGATNFSIAGLNIPSSFSGNAQGGTSAPIVRPNRNPSIVMNYIIKR